MGTTWRYDFDDDEYDFRAEAYLGLFILLKKLDIAIDNVATRRQWMMGASLVVEYKS